LSALTLQHKQDIRGAGRGRSCRRTKAQWEGTAKREAGRGEFWVASWVVQQHSAGHLHWGRKQTSNPPISSTTTPGTPKIAQCKLAPHLERATFMFFLAFE